MIWVAEISFSQLLEVCSFQSLHRLHVVTLTYQYHYFLFLRGHKEVVWNLKILGNVLFSCGSDGVIKVWDLDVLSKGCIKTLSGHENAVSGQAVVIYFIVSCGPKYTIVV